MKRAVIVSVGTAFMVMTLAVTLCGCQGKRVVADNDVPSYLMDSCLFGPVPQIYEEEMLVITEQARRMTKEKPTMAFHRVFGDKSDSAYHEAARRTLPLLKQMIGRKVDYIVDDSLGFTITTPMKILCVFQPQLFGVEREAKVAVQFGVKTDTLPKRVYYVLTGPQGDVAQGSFTMKVDTDTATYSLMIKAPNVPAKYLNHCSTVHFVSDKVYQDMRNEMISRQEKWREEYRVEHGIPDMNSIE